MENIQATPKQFTTIAYVTKDGEKCTATKNNGIVTVQGDKNGVRQIPEKEFIHELTATLPQVDLARTPNKDTVQFKGGEEKTLENTPEANHKVRNWAIGIGGTVATLIGLGVAGRNGHLGKTLQKFLGGAEKDAGKVVDDLTGAAGHTNPHATTKVEEISAQEMEQVINREADFVYGGTRATEGATATGAKVTEEAAAEGAKVAEEAAAGGGAKVEETVAAAEAKTEAVTPKPAEPKPAEPKPAELKPAEPKPAEPKPAELKPAEPKPAEPKPAEPKPVEQKKTNTAEPKETVVAKEENLNRIQKEQDELIRQQEEAQREAERLRREQDEIANNDMLNAAAIAEIMSLAGRKKAGEAATKGLDKMVEQAAKEADKAAETVAKADIQKAGNVIEEVAPAAGKIEAPVYETAANNGEKAADDLFAPKAGDELFAPKSGNELFAQTEKAAGDIAPETRTTSYLDDTVDEFGFPKSTYDDVAEFETKNTSFLDDTVDEYGLPKSTLDDTLADLDNSYTSSIDDFNSSTDSFGDGGFSLF